MFVRLLHIGISIHTHDEYAKFGEVNNHISESNKKSTKESLIDKISRRLLELEFKSDHSIKSKYLKFFVKKILPSIWNMQTHCLKCKKEIRVKNLLL